MAESLKHKTIIGTIWSSVDRFASAGINFVFGLGLARLLMPKEYGLIAMISIFMAISQSIIDSGFSNALIRKKNRTEEDNSTAFYFNIVAGLAMYAIMLLLAPFIASFYNEPILTSIIRVMAVSLFFGSVSIVQQAMLTVKIDFKTQTKISLISVIVSGVIGIVVAYLGYGVWALVAQAVIASFTRTMLLWMFAKWKPTTGFSMVSFHYLFGYGSKLLVAGIMETIYRNLYTIVIGKTFSASQLGFYSRGEQLGYFPANNITGVIQRVTFPVLSEMQEDDERLKRNFFKILHLIVYLTFPAMILLIVIATPLVRILLTEKWLGCVPVIQILSISFMWLPVHILNLNLLQVKGRTDLSLKLEVIKKIIGITLLVATIPMGIMAMCWGRVVYCFIELFINLYYPHRLFDIQIQEQLKETFKIFFGFGIVGAISYYTANMFASDVCQLISGIIVFSCIWASLAIINNEFNIRKIITEKINKR